MMQPAPSNNPVMFRVLGAVGEFKRNGTGWKAHCPGPNHQHGDRKESLSISEGYDGRVLLNCFAQCPTESILERFGLSYADLFEKSPQGGIRRRYRVIDSTGKQLAEHQRDELPSGKKADLRWTKGTKVNDLPLYRLPELLASSTDAPVYLCEGENKADALADRGLIAVSGYGVGYTPTDEALDPLKGREVRLWPDNDTAGLAWAAKLANRLTTLGARVQWVVWTEAPEKGDAADFKGSVAEIEAMVQDAPPIDSETAALVIPASTWTLISSIDLARLDLPEPKWAVPGIVPEGVLLVAGKPKFGKSWWVLDLCIAVATGGKAWGRIPVERGDVLYITFEDSYRRLQDRQQRIVGHAGGIPGLEYVTDCPRSDDGGAQAVLDWVQTHPRARLLVIDPLEYWRPEEDTKKQLYRQDYDSLRPIVEMARSLGISVIVVHHCNKMPNPDDPFDAISGTTGLQGVADAIGVFRKEKGMADAVLFLKGKDVDSAELAFKLRASDPYPASVFELIGSGEEYRMSRERFATLEALWREPWQTPALLAELMDPPVTKGTMRKRLFDMAHDSLVRINDGKYAAGLERDAYLHRYGHGTFDTSPSTPSNGNAGNAPPMQEHSQGVPRVPSVPDTTPVTGVTDSFQRKDGRTCEDCGVPVTAYERWCKPHFDARCPE